MAGLVDETCFKLGEVQGQADVDIQGLGPHLVTDEHCRHEAIVRRHLFCNITHTSSLFNPAVRTEQVVYGDVKINIMDIKLVCFMNWDEQTEQV